MRKPRTILFVLFLLYAVGILSTFTPLKETAFSLTPIILLLTLVGLLYSIKIKPRQLIYILLVGVLGYTVEIIGVKTGFPFGNYKYLEGLIAKLFDVPLVLIVNWSLLVVASFYSFENNPKWVQLVFPPLLITLLDVLIEPIAISLNWWSWENASIPISNYVGWLGTAFLLNFILFKTIKLKEPTISTVQMSRGVLSLQFLFFGILNITL